MATNERTVTLTGNDWFGLLCCVAMLIGALYARAVLSIGMILLFLHALRPQVIKKHWSYFVKSKFALACVLFFCSYLVSGIWSTNLEQWNLSLQIKLPFLIMPFALLALPFHKVQFTRLLWLLLLGVLLSGMLYSWYFYFQDPDAYLHNYHFRSPMDSDYVRFTISVALGMLSVFYLLLNRAHYQLKKGTIVLLCVWSVLALLYIHLQAAKSGIVALYLILGVFFVYRVIRKLNWLVVLAGFAALLIAVIGFSNLPSIENQIANLEREKQIWDNKDEKAYKTTGSVLPRLLSYQVAFDLIQQKPLQGLGVGDVNDQLKDAYILKYPMLSQHQRIIPHNQLIYVVLAIGAPLSVFYLLMLFAPLYGRQYFRNVYLFTCCLVMYFGLTIESMLEVQFGVFVYLFFTSLWLAIGNVNITKKATETEHDSPLS